jgi:hypothetical protein
MVAGIKGESSSKPPSDQPELAYAAVFYPQSPDEARAAPIDAPAGAELRGMDFHMAKVNTFRVRGKVAQLPSGKAAYVILTAKGASVASAPHMVQPQPDGSFEIAGITPGQWLLRAAGEGAGVSLGLVNATSQVVTVVDRHVDGILVVLAPPRELAGTITVEGQGSASPKAIQVTLEGLDAGKEGGHATAGDDGRFTVQGLMADRYRVLVSGAPGNTYVKSVRYGTDEVTDDGVDLSGGGATGTLDIKLSPGGAEVGGLVAADDGKPMPGVTVALIPDSRRYSLFQSGVTDQSGAFRFHAVPPGGYKLLAWEDVLPGAWCDPEFLKPFESQAQAVSVKENDRPTLALKAIHAEAKK